MKKNVTTTEIDSSTPTALVSIRFEVEVPHGIPTGEKLWISGNAENLGQWNGRGLAMSRADSQLFRCEARFPKGCLIFYKITRGNWDQVEVDKDGYDIEDRSFVAKAGKTLKVKVAGFATHGARAQPSTRDPHVHELGTFGEKTTGLARKVLIHLPPNYATEPQSYPVIYMLDGQNLFDAATAFMGQEWAADKTHDRLFYSKQIEPFLIVAIPNTYLRHDFYTPIRDPMLGEGGKLYLLENMIQQEILPVLQSNYRIRTGPQNTGVIGSSLGGLAAFHLGWNHPDRYGLIGAVSPSLWWNNYYTYGLIDQDGDHQSRKHLKIWMDMGTRESQYMHRPLIAVSRLAYLLRQNKYNIQLYIDKDGSHSERSWRNRLEQIFKFLMGRDDGFGRESFERS